MADKSGLGAGLNRNCLNSVGWLGWKLEWKSGLCAIIYVNIEEGGQERQNASASHGVSLPAFPYFNWLLSDHFMN